MVLTTTNSCFCFSKLESQKMATTRAHLKPFFTALWNKTTFAFTGRKSPATSLLKDICRPSVNSDVMSSHVTRTITYLIYTKTYLCIYFAYILSN